MTLIRLDLRWELKEKKKMNGRQWSRASTSIAHKIKYYLVAEILFREKLRSIEWFRAGGQREVHRVAKIIMLSAGLKFSIRRPAGSYLSNFRFVARPGGICFSDGHTELQ